MRIFPFHTIDKSDQIVTVSIYQRNTVSHKFYHTIMKLITAAIKPIIISFRSHRQYQCRDHTPTELMRFICSSWRFPYSSDLMVFVVVVLPFGCLFIFVFFLFCILLSALCYWSNEAILQWNLLEAKRINKNNGISLNKFMVRVLSFELRVDKASLNGFMSFRYRRLCDSGENVWVFWWLVRYSVWFQQINYSKWIFINFLWKSSGKFRCFRSLAGWQRRPAENRMRQQAKSINFVIALNWQCKREWNSCYFLVLSSTFDGVECVTGWLPPQRAVTRRIIIIEISQNRQTIESTSSKLQAVPHPCRGNLRNRFRWCPFWNVINKQKPWKCVRHPRWRPPSIFNM